jgi:hypothetical protein
MISRRRDQHPDLLEGVDANVLRATRLMRLFNEQLEAMAKLKGTSGQQKVRNKKRCRLHGGCSTGPKTSAGRERCRRALWKHGEYSAAAKARRAEMGALLRQARVLLDSFKCR